MAGSVNKVILVGNLGKDPEIRNLPSGGKVANLSIATSETWRDKSSGERKEKTEWHRVTIFNENLVKVVEQYVKKGAKLYIEGALQTRKWQDQSGQDRYSTEVVLQGFNGNLTMLDARGSGGGMSAGMAEDGPGFGDAGGYGGGGGGYGAESGGMGGGSSGGYGESKRGASKGGPSKAIDKPMDDEIPF